MRHHGDTALDHPLHPRQCVLIKNFYRQTGQAWSLKQLKPGIFWNFFLFSCNAMRMNTLLALLELLVAAGGLDREVVLDRGPLATGVSALRYLVLLLGLLGVEALR